MDSTRFWSNVHKTDGCWIWTAGRFTLRDGTKTYGCVTVDGKSKYAHRVAWELTNGPVPDGFNVLHSCDNPPCCRPDHLFLGTHDDNMKDKASKHRAPRANAKLTEDDVAAIRAAAVDRRYGWVPKIAKQYGVSTHTVYAIVYGQTWPRVKNHQAR